MSDLTRDALEAALSAEFLYDNDPYFLRRDTDAILATPAGQALAEVVAAAQRLVDDEESGVGGFGPDVTHVLPLRAALDKLREAAG